MTRRRVAIVGFGQLGLACAGEASSAADLELAGVVRRATSPALLTAPFQALAVATHLRDLGRVDAALLCVPPTVTSDAARDVLQLRIPLVECAMLEEPTAQAHYEAIDSAARNHRVAAWVGAGWDPGILPLLRHAFEVLVPEGLTSVTARPGVRLHHALAAREIEGVREALSTEFRGEDGRMTRYVYAELAQGADPERVQAALDADPLFAGTRTLLFPVSSITELQKEGHGIVLVRRGTAHRGAHQNILLEARFDATIFAARIMLDAVRRLPELQPGAHRYFLAASAAVL